LPVGAGAVVPLEVEAEVEVRTPRNLNSVESNGLPAFVTEVVFTKIEPAGMLLSEMLITAGETCATPMIWFVEPGRP